MAFDGASHRTIHMAVALNRGAVEKLSVSRQREKRPGVPVHVVLEVKYFREAGAGNLALGPGSVGVLHASEVVDAALDAVTVGIIKSAEAHERPGGLRGGAGA